MSYVGNIALGQTFDTKFCTVQSTGAPTTLSSSPVISCYAGNSTTEITAGITLTVDFDGRTGLNNVRVVATSGNGYATATDNQLVITTGTVNSVSAVGYVVAEFSIENRALTYAGTTTLGPVVITGSGDALSISSSGGNGVALKLAGNGTGAGLLATGGATGPGISAVGGATSGSGIKSVGTAGNALALELAGQGSAAGMSVTGGATGQAVKLVGGGTSGDGLTITTTSGHGINIAATGTDKHGATITGGNGGTSDGMKLVAGTGGVALNAATATMAITGDVTGNLSGSVGSVTGAVGSVTGNVGGNVAGSVGSVAAAVTVGTISNNVITAASINSGAFTAAKFAASAIDATALATDAVNEIVAAILAGIIEGSVTVKQSLQLSNAAAAGKLSGAATTTVTIRSLADDADRIVATVTADGDRTAVTPTFS